MHEASITQRAASDTNLFIIKKIETKKTNKVSPAGQATEAKARVITHQASKMKFKGKPFIKWVGGKGQLLEQLDQKLPADFDNWENVTYIEPFVGGVLCYFTCYKSTPILNTA